MKTAADYIEQISDDFQSTFVAVAPNVLQNMLGHTEQDFEELTKIIQKYLPNANVEFHKVMALENGPTPSYGMYIIEVRTEREA